MKGIISIFSGCQALTSGKTNCPQPTKQPGGQKLRSQQLKSNSPIASSTLFSRTLKAMPRTTPMEREHSTNMTLSQKLKMTESSLFKTRFIMHGKLFPQKHTHPKKNSPLLSPVEIH